MKDYTLLYSYYNLHFNISKDDFVKYILTPLIDIPFHSYSYIPYSNEEKIVDLIQDLYNEMNDVKLQRVVLVSFLGWVDKYSVNTSKWEKTNRGKLYKDNHINFHTNLISKTIEIIYNLIDKNIIKKPNDLNELIQHSTNFLLNLNNSSFNLNNIWEMGNTEYHNLMTIIPMYIHLYKLLYNNYKPYSRENIKQQNQSLQQIVNKTKISKSRSTKDKKRMFENLDITKFKLGE